MSLIPKSFLNSVVAIGIDNNTTKHWIATGFFYGYFNSKISEEESTYDTYLITNKHVIEKYEKIYIRCNPPLGKKAMEFPLDLTINNIKTWTCHPDEKIDIVAILVNLKILIDKKMEVNFFQSDHNKANIEKMKLIDVTEGDFIYVLGFPLGLVGNQRNNVIARSGCIAQINNTLYMQDKDFLIDAAVFPGNSGGPVILKPELCSLMGTKSHDQTFLLGIVSGYIPYQDTAVSLQTGKTRLISMENSGLATVIPVDFIDETIEEDKKNRSKKII